MVDRITAISEELHHNLWRIGKSVFDVPPEVVLGMPDQNINRAVSNRQDKYSGHRQCDILQSCDIDWYVYDLILKYSNENYAREFVNHAIDFECLLTLTREEYIEIIPVRNTNSMQLWLRIKRLQEQFS